MINTKPDTIISSENVKTAYIIQSFEDTFMANPKNFNTSKDEYIKKIISERNIYLSLVNPTPEEIEYSRSLYNEPDWGGSINPFYFDPQDIPIKCFIAGTAVTTQLAYHFLTNDRCFYKITDKNTIDRIIKIHNEMLLSHVISIY